MIVLPESGVIRNCQCLLFLKPLPSLDAHPFGYGYAYSYKFPLPLHTCNLPITRMLVSLLLAQSCLSCAGCRSLLRASPGMVLMGQRLGPVFSLPSETSAGAACGVRTAKVHAEAPHRECTLQGLRPAASTPTGIILCVVPCALKAPSRSSNNEGGRPSHRAFHTLGRQAGTDPSVIACFPLIPSLS